ncbi:MAG: 3-deoxy-D-manno-octulosonic acid transferase [Marinilabiliaceae bacterium]|nr:3-deoxy-D-manno-octulosonic acid transferase [Marinilabiliaceae bacterium]
MKLLYNIGILLFHIAINIASLFNSKAKLLVRGRIATKSKLSYLKFPKPVIWFHAASLGEFEQGRPIIEAIKKKYPDKIIVLTFFSPSGYEVRKKYSFVDYVFYLPGDTAGNAKFFIKKINPEMAFFIKYEFWYHYLKTLKDNNIPVYGISVIFRKQQLFFQWYGKWFRKLLLFYNRFYLQDEKSERLFKQLGLTHSIVCGDTRFDRVVEIASSAKDIEIARQFIGNSNKVIVAGSTWLKDEIFLSKYINRHPDIKLVIAPHEVHEEHILKLESLFRVPFFRYTQAPHGVNEFQVMIVNTIGLLSSLYKYGNIAYIGGGFGKGIHNTLEAATFDMPVIFGPKYKKFKEAVDLIERGGGFSISGYDDLDERFTKFFSNNEKTKLSGLLAGEYVKSMSGATQIIMSEIFDSVKSD